MHADVMWWVTQEVPASWIQAGDPPTTSRQRFGKVTGTVVGDDTKVVVTPYALADKGKFCLFVILAGSVGYFVQFIPW